MRFCHGGADDLVTGGPDDSRAARLDCNPCCTPCAKACTRQRVRFRNGLCKDRDGNTIFPHRWSIKRRVTMCGAACGLG